MTLLSQALTRLIALCALSAAAELLTQGERLRGGVKLISGLLTTGTILELVFALEKALTG